jgi:hypothetical protein
VMYAQRFFGGSNLSGRLARFGRLRADVCTFRVRLSPRSL